MEKKKPLRKPEFRLERMDKELLLFNPVSTRILYLNEQASVIWQLCDGTRTAEGMIELLAAAYPEASKSIGGDVYETLKIFIENSVIDLI
jgi:hypothetical protein